MKSFLKKHLSQIIFWLILASAFLIRTLGLGQNPPALYWEEIALGYDAYSLTQTGADHHGNTYPLLAFESFGDWKPSLYFYVLSPFVKILGLTPLAVRLPSALAGTLTVIGLYFLVKKLSKKKTLALWAMFFTAFNPWAIQFSRGGWEVNLALVLILWGVIALIESLNRLKKSASSVKPQLSSTQIKDLSPKTSKKKFSFQLHLDWFFLLGVILLILSMYAYHAARIVAPLLGLFLLLVWLIKQKFNWHQIWQTITLAFLLTFVCLIPFLQNLSSPQLNTRFAQTSILNDVEPILQSNVCLETAGQNLFSRLVCHRFLYQGLYVTENFSRHLNPSFLFLNGDSNFRHSTHYFGLFFPFDAVLLLLGFGYFIFSRKIRAWQKTFIVFWLLISIVPAALSLEAPHALRILLGLPAWITLLAFGANGLYRTCRHYLQKFWAQIIQVLVILLTLGQFSLWTYHYIHVYPQLSANSWQAIYPSIFSALQKAIASHSSSSLPLNIYFSRAEGRPAMAYWFYHQTNPQLVQAQNETARKDQGEYLTFIDQNRDLHFIDGQFQIETLAPDSLVVLPVEEMKQLQIRFPRLQILETINDQKDQPAWQIARYV